MTNTVSLVLTGAGSVAGSRPELAGQGRPVLRLVVITALRSVGQGERGEECCFWDGECHGRCMLRVVR